MESSVHVAFGAEDGFVVAGGDAGAGGDDEKIVVPVGEEETAKEREVAVAFLEGPTLFVGFTAGSVSRVQPPRPSAR
jgi:hypothetical protein